MKDFFYQLFNLKTKKSTVEIGKVLFEDCLYNTKTILDDNNKIETLGISNVNRNYLYQELCIIYMYTVVYHFRGVLNNKKLEFEILDMMRLAYYNFLRNVLNFDDKMTEEAHHYLIHRFTQYEEFSKKSGRLESSDDLFKLVKKMLDNLSRGQSSDLVSIMSLTALTMSDPTIYPFFQNIVSKHNIYSVNQ